MPPTEHESELHRPAAASSPRVDVTSVAFLTDLVARVTGRPITDVRAMLRAETWRPGSTVRRAFAARGLRPHAWSDGLVDFYKTADAFVFELVVWNRNRLKELMRWQVARALARQGPGLRVLCVGDGLGFDSLALARAGHDVTYAEYPGFGEQFARELFAAAGVTVRVETDTGALPRAAFDAVVCLDVLEHVPNVPATVRDLAAALRPGGLLVANGPFYLILPAYPTHLRANRRYCATLHPYTQANLGLVDGSWVWAPLVFRKPGPGAYRGTAVSWLNRAMIRAFAAFGLPGRVSGWPYYPVHVLRWAMNRGWGGLF